jgi:hypothetical protein
MPIRIVLPGRYFRQVHINLQHVSKYSFIGLLIGSSEPLSCPAGRYGNSTGLVNDACSGLCAAGYWCHENSIMAKQVECGGHGFYCPQGSSKPVPVDSGYYTSGGATSRIQDHQILCEA